jgi:hypothetical protein
MLTESTHYGLWITWRGLQCEAAIGLVHLEETTLQTVLIHEYYVVVEVLTIYTIFADELLEYPPNDEVMKLRQSEGQRLQWRRCRIDIKGAPTRKSHSQAMVQIPCSSQSTVQVPSSHGSPHPPPPQSPHPQDVPFGPPPRPEKLASPPPCHPENVEKLASPHLQETPNITSPPPPPPPPPPHETTKPTSPNESAQNNHAKAGTSGPNTSVIGSDETPLLPVNQSDVLAGADKSVDDISKKSIGTSGPNASVIASAETPLGKKALEKPSAISNKQGKKLAENKISTPHTIGKKSLEKPSAISKLQEEKLAKK